MKKLLVLTLSVFLIGISCKDTSDSKTTAAIPAPEEEPLDWPSIQKIYNERISERTNPLPLKQIIEKDKLNPVDEAPKDTAFFVFRSQVLEAVQKKDLFSFIDLCATTIKVTVGESEGGPASLIEHWGLDSPAKVANSAIWKHLKEVLSLGGVFNTAKSSFYAPYTYATFPDGYEEHYGVITGSGVRMRSAANLNSSIVKKLSYDIVEVLEVLNDQTETIGGETHPWVHIKLLDGKTEGYAYGKYLRRPIDYRLGFEKKGKTWKIAFFVAEG